MASNLSGTRMTAANGWTLPQWAHLPSPSLQAMAHGRVQDPAIAAGGIANYVGPAPNVSGALPARFTYSVRRGIS